MPYLLDKHSSPESLISPGVRFHGCHLPVSWQVIVCDRGDATVYEDEELVKYHHHQCYFSKAHDDHGVANFPCKADSQLCLQRKSGLIQNFDQTIYSYIFSEKY